MTTVTATSAKMTCRERWRKRIFRLLRSVATIYLTVLLVLGSIQNKLIFLGASTQGRPESIVTPLPQTELLTLATPQGIRVAALFGKARNSNGSIDPANSRPTVLFFYGNAMCMADALDEFRMFRQLGNNVMIVDYLGYGMSGGRAGEQGCYDAAEAAYQYLLQRTDLDTSRIVAAGWSLGGAVAIDLARRHAGEGHISAVMTFSSFTSLVDLAGVHYPFVPVSLILAHRFDSEKKIAHLDVPIFIGHGKKDEIVPFPMSNRLAAAAQKSGNAVVRLTIEGAGHNDFFITGENPIETSVAAFLKTYCGGA